MCGILGWVTRHPVREPEAALDHALDALQHRGPDGAGKWLAKTEIPGEQIAFGHRRLAIIDISSDSSQPFASHDGRFTLTYNGEIYNYLELRTELLEHGHRFVTKGDTEVVVEAYRRWGEGAFSRFRGMFALALWDAERGKLVLARDQVGKKPLFLAPLPGGFAFASEINALRRLPGVDASLNFDEVPNYLAHRYVDGPQTFFNHIRKLQPGTIIVYECGHSREKQFYELPLITMTQKKTSLSENVERLGQLLNESVGLRMRSDAPFGLYLSGGLDSSVLLAIMSQHSASPIRTFSVGFEKDDASELGPAARTAKEFQADHTELTISSAAFAEAWAHCVTLRGAPVSEASDVAIYLLSVAARSSVKMVLTGEGADELFAGYPKFLGECWLQWYHSIVPPSIHRTLLNPVVSRLPSRYERLKIFSRAAGTREAAVRARTWFSSGDAHLLASLAPCGSVQSRFQSGYGLSAIRTLQLHDFQHWLPDNLLERGDRMMMGGSIEGRMPFMDVELAKFAAGLPEDQLVRRGRGKFILRELARTLLRPELLERPKIGFTVPLDRWFRGPLRSMLLELLQGRDARVRALLNPIVLDAILARHMAGSQNHAKLLWSVANLELFLLQNSA